MITMTLITIFVLGYLAIAFEEPLKLNKAAAALLTGVLCWTIYILQSPSSETVSKELFEHLGEIASILFFLLGAMTIVELIDSHNGFEIITQKITTTSKKRLLFIVSGITFLLSALLDNLTTAIVMTSLCTKILSEKEDRLWFAGMIVIAANAGGAWSPLGDVTTTMLWVKHKVGTVEVMVQLFLASATCLVVPLLVLSRTMKGELSEADISHSNHRHKKLEPWHQALFLTLGLVGLLSVPIFKAYTHLPPYMGMMFSLGILSIIAEILSKRHFSLTDITGTNSHNSPTFKALTKIELPSILFFLGILMTIAAMESLGMIYGFGVQIQETMDVNLFVSLLGIASAIIDNVPIVAASMGMFQYGVDHEVWHFIAFAAGTGGSMLIIGSAAGVVAMGMEKISFFWYLKRITLLAALGYFAGIGVFFLQQQF
jgi:Na+/H+ antiporter NhaD/arsenite permease-like protein